MLYQSYMFESNTISNFIFNFWIDTSLSIGMNYLICIIEQMGSFVLCHYLWGTCIMEINR